MRPSLSFDQLGYVHPQHIWKRSGKWFLYYWLFCNWKLIYFPLCFLYLFFLAVTLLDSRSVQGELGWIASPLEGGVSSEALSGQEGEKE